MAMTGLKQGNTMSEATANNFDLFEKFELFEEFNDLVEKISNNKTSELVKTELKATFDIVASISDKKSIFSAMGRIELLKEVVKISKELELNNINPIKKEKLRIRLEVILYFISLKQENKKKDRVFFALEQNNKNLKRNLKEKLDTINPYMFERILAELLKRIGYINVEVTKKSRDGGIDIIAYANIGKLHRIKTAVQVKRTKANVGTPIVDNLRGAMNACGADRGLIITTSDFSKDCRKLTEYNNALKVDLINGNELIDLLIQHEIGVKSENITLYSIDENFLNSI